MFFIGVLLLGGCPEPLDEKEPLSEEQRQAVDDSKRNTNSVPTDIDGTKNEGQAMAPPSMGTFPGDLAVNEVKPQYTQEELKDDAVVHGYVKCDDCLGKILIRVLPPPPESGEEPEDGEKSDNMQLITQMTVEKAGKFQLYIPKNQKVILQVVDDIDGNLQPSQGERMGMRGSGALIVEDEVEGIELTVGVFPQREPEGFVEPPTIPDGTRVNESGELQGPPPDDISGDQQFEQPTGDNPQQNPGMPSQQDGSMNKPPNNVNQPPVDE
jgi:hypothetical protein